MADQEAHDLEIVETRALGQGGLRTFPIEARRGGGAALWSLKPRGKVMGLSEDCHLPAFRVEINGV